VRAWISLVALVAGCAGAAGGSTSSTEDPLSLPETPLAAETLPGALDGAWPLQIARGDGAWLVPFSDGGAVSIRRVGDDGARDDRFVDSGALVGAAATADGFAVVVASNDEFRAHFFAADGADTVVHAPLAGDPVQGIASDGVRLLVAATQGGEIAIEQPRPLTATLALVARDGARVLDLGTVATAPVPWGDDAGFIVSGRVLLDGASGAMSLAPGRQVRDARVFRMPVAAGTLPTSDTISLGPPSSDGWVTLDGLVGWASRDPDGARLELVTSAGRALVEVGDDLTSRTRHALPSTTRADGGQSWVAAASGAHVVWAATAENDPVFAILDASAMQPESGVIRIRNATSRTTIVSPGAVSVLLAWTEADGVVRYAVAPW
jgi:hypothetical protein